MEMHLPHKVKHGVHVRGAGKKLDIIVTEINHVNDKLEACLTIKGLDGFDTLHLTSPCYIPLDGEGLHVGIKEVGRDTHLYCGYSRKYNVSKPRYYGVLSLNRTSPTL